MSINVDKLVLVWGGIAANGLDDVTVEDTEATTASYSSITGTSTLVISDSDSRTVTAKVLKDSPMIPQWKALFKLKKALPLLYKGAIDSTASPEARLEKWPTNADTRTDAVLEFNFLCAKCTD